MEFTETYPSTSTVRWCRRYTSGIHAGNGFRILSEAASAPSALARIQFDLDLVSGLAHLHPPPNPGDRNGVANGVHRDISFHVDRALVQTVHFGNPRRQRFQVQALDREQFPRHGPDIFLVSRVDAVAPLARLDSKRNLARNLFPDPPAGIQWKPINGGPGFVAGMKSPNGTLLEDLLRCQHLLAHALPGTRGYKHTCFYSPRQLWF